VTSPAFWGGPATAFPAQPRPAASSHILIEKAVKAAGESLLSRLSAAHEGMTTEISGLLAAGQPEGLLPCVERLRRSHALIERVYVLNQTNAFVYPPPPYEPSLSSESEGAYPGDLASRVKEIAGKSAAFSNNLPSPPHQAAGDDSMARIAESEASTTNAPADFAKLEGARSLHRDGQHEAAAREYQRVLAQPGISHALRAEAALSTAQCYRKLGEFEFAAGVLRQVAGYSSGALAAKRALADPNFAVRSPVGHIYSLLALSDLADAYREEEVEGETRVVLGFDPKVAPIKVGVFPLMKKDGLPEVADEVYRAVRRRFNAFYDDSGAIGRRYRRMDEAGTPYCVTVDQETLAERTVTVRDRDAMTQERVSIDRLLEYLTPKVTED